MQTTLASVPAVCVLRVNNTETNPSPSSTPSEMCIKKNNHPSMLPSDSDSKHNNNKGERGGKRRI